jgi:hypothetical protein
LLEAKRQDLENTSKLKGFAMQTGAPDRYRGLHDWKNQSRGF